VPLIAAIGVGIVVIGVGAGALLSGGGTDKGTDGKTVAATSAAPGQSSAPAVDPARQQAVELDKLLADSGSSRATVIKSVADVKNCTDLDTAGSSLRDAARQRGDLVTRLGKLSVDKLPGHADLTTALTRAWQASAAADSHYAAWADQARNRKVCHKGHARVTGETQAGNRASGTASAQKVKAASLWNAIARRYGLTQRQPTQL
jgi:chorismate mutase